MAAAVPLQSREVFAITRICSNNWYNDTAICRVVEAEFQI